MRYLLSGASKIGLLALLSLGPSCQKADASLKPPAQEPAVAVEQAKVVELMIPRTLRLTGELRGAREAALAANVNGKVIATRVERGQKVNKGDLLAQVDVRSAALQLAEARVQVETSKTQESIVQADCERFEKLKAGGVISEYEYDQMLAKCKTAPLNVKAATARQSIVAKNVGDGAIRSPFAGVVTERFVEVGEYVQAASRVVSLAQVDPLRLEFSVPEQNFTELKSRAAVHFRVAAYPGRVFLGRVEHISGAVRDTRDIMVEATVDNAEGKLLPGMFADVELVVGQEALPVLPKSAVFEENGKWNAFVVKDGLLEQRVLQPAPETDGRIPVRQGVRVGDRVVVARVDKLENGQRVK